MGPFFVPKHYQQRAKLPATIREILRRCDFERALDGDISCVKKLFE